VQDHIQSTTGDALRTARFSYSETEFEPIPIFKTGIEDPNWNSFEEPDL
jgi:hypothetical protein